MNGGPSKAIQPLAIGIRPQTPEIPQDIVNRPGSSSPTSAASTPKSTPNFSTTSVASPASPGLSSSLVLPLSLPPLEIPPTASRKYKRLSLTSNDLLYERDRFHARLHNLNGSSSVPKCELCDVGKTAKLSRSAQRRLFPLKSRTDSEGPNLAICRTPITDAGKLAAASEDEETTTSPGLFEQETNAAAVNLSTVRETKSGEGDMAEKTSPLRDVAAENEETYTNVPSESDATAFYKTSNDSQSPSGKENASINSESTQDLFHDTIPPPCIDTELPLDPKSSKFQQLPISKHSIEALDPPIKTLTPEQLRQVFDFYFMQPLPPTNAMFPWLHGLHSDNFAQRQFFMQLSQNHTYEYLNNRYTNHLNYSYSQFENSIHSQRLNHTKPSDVRFLMIVEHGTCESEKMFRNSVSSSEILQPIDVSRLEMYLEIQNLIWQCLPEDVDRKILLKILVHDCEIINLFPKFLLLDPDSGVNLRNFHIQVAKLATFSDMVVPESPYSASLSRLLWLAQRYEAFINLRESEYNVFVMNGLDLASCHSSDGKICSEIQDLKCSGGVPDSKCSSDVSLTELRIAVDKAMVLNDHQSLFTARPSPTLPPVHTLHHKTMHPMDVLLDPAVISSLRYWDGDFQLKERLETTSMSRASQIYRNVWIGNVWDANFRVNGEEIDNAVDNSSPAIPSAVYFDPELSSIVTKNPKLPGCHLVNFLLAVHCHERAVFPEPSSLLASLFLTSISSREDRHSNKIDLDFPPSGSVGLGNCRIDNFVSILNICKLLYLHSLLLTHNTPALLIYCSDGFTELLLLVLCYIIYALAVPLDEAILMLHLKYKRPFYLFNLDVQMLRKLEKLLISRSPIKLGEKIRWGELEQLGSNEILNILLRPTRQAAHLLGYIADSDDSSSDEDSDDEDSELGEGRWVEEVDGSIPSRILPYLYLGSLRHASSLVLMKKLSIYHIISVGEQLEWLLLPAFLKEHHVDVEEHQMFDLCHITPKSSDVKDSVRTILRVKNLQDDGIDELLDVLPVVLDFIERSYKTGNILVHCRVGVSRSATVVIAEVMKRLDLDLARAYMYVRVRRLNIVIQPNLKLMYELFKWEERVRKEQGKPLRQVDWFVMCREITRLNMPYLNA